VFEAAFSLLLAAHLLCVNAASGGPIVAAWLDWRGFRGDEAAAKAALYLARWSLASLLIGAGLGLAIGWLKWDADYRALWLGPLSYKLHWAGFEAIFSLVLLSGWWLCLPGRAGGRSAAAIARGLAALLASTNLLYHFPLLFSVAVRLHNAGQTGGERIGGAAFRKLMISGETPSLAVHVALASVAVAGVMLLGLALRLKRAGEEQRAARIALWGGRWAVIPSLAQLPVGFWALTSLSPGEQSRLMGTDGLATLLFVGALLASFWLVNDLARIALGETAKTLLVRAMAAMLVTVTLMTAMQQQARPPRHSQNPSHHRVTQNDS
jgi:hypothetical protein